MAFRRSIYIKLLSYFLLAVSVPVFLTSTVAYAGGKRIIENNTYESLKLASNQKSYQIETLVQKETELVRTLSLTQPVQAISTLPSGAEVDSRLLQRFTNLIDVDSDFEEIFYISPGTGVVLASTTPTQLGTNKTLEPYYVKGKEKIFVQDLYFSISHFRSIYTISLPVTSADGTIAGVFGAHINLDTIDKIMVESSGLGLTGETYLINKAHQFVSKSRFNQDSPSSIGLNTQQADDVLAGKDGRGIYTNYRNKQVYGTYHFLKDRNLAIFTEIEQAEAVKPLLQIRNIILGIVAALMLGLVLLAIAFTSRFVKPIHRLTEGVSRFGQGNLGIRIILKTHDEVEQLANAFNQMAQDIQEKIKQLHEAQARLIEINKIKSEFVMLTSHNLRTPLSFIEASATVLSRSNLSETQKNMLSGLLVNTQRLGTLVDELLTISSLESGTELVLKPVKAADIMARITKNASSMAAANGNKVIEHIEVPDALINAHTERLSAALHNIIDNANKFTKNGTITINAKVTPDHLQIDIEDTGIGIAKEELPNLFSKFHRASSVLRYDYDGEGIGLYLSKLVIDEHEGQLTVTSEVGKGTKVTVTIPLVVPQKPPQTTPLKSL